MTAIDPRETVRYATRLFGYFLVVTIVGGGIAAGGAVLLRDENVFSGGSVDIGAEVIVGGALAGVGLLLVVAGVFAIVLNVVADAVRYGVEDAPAEPDTEPVPSQQPAWTPDRRRRPPSRTPPPRGRPATRAPDSQQATPSSAKPADEQSESDEPWKREVEEQLSERPARDSGAETPPASEPTAGRPPAEQAGDTGVPAEESEDTAVPAEASTGTVRAEESRDQRGGTDELPSHDRETAEGATAQPDTGVEREPGDEQSSDRPNARERPADAHQTETTGQAEEETWVSGDEVNERDDAEEASGAATDDDPVADDSAAESDDTDTSTGASGTPAWLDSSGEEDTN